MLLYCVGRFNPSLIAQYTERLSRYSAEDYKLLNKFVGLFEKKVTTPNVLTETINLIDKKNGRFAKLLGNFDAVIADFEELYIPSKHIVRQHPRHFPVFGITDLVLYELAQQSFLVLTDDEDIWSFIAGNIGSTLNFDQLRSLLLQKGPPNKRGRND